MAADKPKAPERIWITDGDLFLWPRNETVRAIRAWDFGGLDDTEYVRADLYPATPEVIRELVAELQSIRDFAASLQYETGAISRGGLQMVVRRMDEALAALTAKESR